jgi:bifunctional enzyme CysN/CysC
MVDSAPPTFVVWFTGISGAGKSTIASGVEQRLRALGLAIHNLDGDSLRTGLNSDLGFSDDDRTENIRRIGEVARLFNIAGVSVLVAAISPFRAGRDQARTLIGPGRFVEVHVDTPLEVAESRDTKGLYRKARSGQLANFTGIDSPYEAPLNPEVRIDSTHSTSDDEADEIVHTLMMMGLLGHHD